MIKQLSFLACRTLLCTVIAALALTGCVKISRPQAFDGVPIPFDGGKISPRVWEAAGQTSATQPVAESQDKDRKSKKQAGSWQKKDGRAVVKRVFSWPLPFNSLGWEFTVDSKAGTAEVTRTAWNSLGTHYLLLLPFHVARRTSYYHKGSDEPVGRRDVQWNLFWASSKESGDVPGQVAVSGVPLFWSHLAMRKGKSPESASVSLDNFLWTLGPVLIRFNATDSKDRAGGYLFTPFFLGGFQNFFLWTDLHLDAYEGKKRDSPAGIEMHGPLFGFLGSMDLHQGMHPKDNDGKPAGKEFSRLRLVLFGSLWLDYSDKGGKDDLHGPLWGMIGWGHKDGHFRPRIAWIALPLE